MDNQLHFKIPALLLLALAVSLFCSSTAHAAATIIIENADAQGVGFNDPTPAAPVGGNMGTTIGQQRLNAFNFAASIWGATISSGPVIVIRASWGNFTNSCTANSGTLGSAGGTTLYRDFPGAPFSGTWYSVALANALIGRDLNGATAEINATFNVRLGTSGCLESLSWYYGLDTNHTTNQINLVTVLLHEFGHGLGFQSFTNEETGALNSGFPSAFDHFLFDNTANKTWVQMTDAERVASAINTGNLVWHGPHVVANAGILTAGKDASGRPQVFAPNPVDDGSSISHWAREASPNQLMEPNINRNLTHSVTMPQDLTLSLLTDIGWPTGPPPTNDSLANAQIISGCSGSVTGSNSTASHEAGEPSHSPDGNAGGGSVWYQWQAPSSGSVTIDTAGSNYDTLLAVYTGGTSVGNLTPIVSNDDVSPGSVITSTVTFTATAGTVYKIAVDGWGGARGNIVLNWTQSNCSVGPSVLIEEGTVNRALALDSVTQARGPFPIVGANNFSVDQRTRVMLFTTNLGLNPGQEAQVKVRVQGVPLLVERVGPLAGVSNASYIIVKLDNSTPVGNNLPVVVTLNNAASINDARIDITAN